MSYNPNIHHRKSIRLKGYDYTQAGLYFITICTQNRDCLFGEIRTDEMKLNDAGRMIETEWVKLKNRFQNIEIHEYIAMPNHFHGILEIVGSTVGATLVVAQNNNGATTDNNGATTDNNGATTDNNGATTDNNGATTRVAPTGKTIGDMMDAFKSITTVEYIRGVKTLGWKPFDGKLWQRNYWEHIIRNGNDFNRIAEYIINNPKNWDNDKLK